MDQHMATSESLPIQFPSRRLSGADNSLRLEPVLPSTALECFLAALQNFLDQFSDRGRINRTHVLRCHTRVAVLSLSRRREPNDQFGVSQNRNVRIVSREDKLSTLFLVAHPR